MIYDPVVKSRAIELRKKGLLFTQISVELGISKSTAFAWTKDVKLTPSERKRVDKSIRASQTLKILHLAEINKSRHISKDLAIAEKAKSIVNSITLDNNHKALLCSVMFWCEGGKDIAGGIQFINSDPNMVSAFLTLFRDSFDLDERRFRALIHLHGYHNPSKQLKYWAKVTDIPTDQFYKPYLKPNTGKNIHPGYAGCISVRYADRSVGKLMQMIYTEFSSKYRGVR